MEKFKLNDKVFSNHFGIGEIILIKGNYFVIAWDEYSESLLTSDEYDEYILPSYDDRFYGSFNQNDLDKYNICIYDYKRI